MLVDFGRHDQFSQLFVYDLLGVRAEDQMDLVCLRVQAREEPLHINGAAGSSGSKNEFHFRGGKPKAAVLAGLISGVTAWLARCI